LKNILRRYPELYLLLLGVAIALGSLPYRSLFPFDDTFITFRYAANFAHGHGFVWNIGGPHTEGYTNFLFVVLLGACSFLNLDLVACSQIISILATLVTSIAIYQVVARLLKQYLNTDLLWPAFLASVLYLIDPFIWYNAWSGMETSLFAMFVVLCVRSLTMSTNYRSSFLLATCAALTRPEGALMGVIILFVVFIRERESRAKIVMSFGTSFVLPLTLYATWKYFYFGWLLPNSFYVKVGQPQLGHGTPMHGLAGVASYLKALFYIPLLALFVFLRPRSDNAARFPIAVWASLLWGFLLIVFYLFPEPMQPNYDRFLVTIGIVLLIPASLGVYKLSLRMKSTLARTALIVLVIAFHLFSAVRIRNAHAYITRDQTFDYRYEAIAEIFRTIPNHEQLTLAWGDAGKLPYYSGMKNIDVVGLNTNSIAHASNADEVLALIAHERPEIMIVPTETRNANATDSCAQIIRWGHGLIGHSYPRLATYSGLADYKAIVLIPQSVYDLVILCDTRSSQFGNIEKQLTSLIGRNPIVQLPPKCFK
jgi:arabinofuranosyltransferase